MDAATVLQNFNDAIVEFIPRAENGVANDLAQEASGYSPSAGVKFKSARVNGQAETANKVIIGVIKKAMEDNPRRWHEVLGETLWACRLDDVHEDRMMALENIRVNKVKVARAYNKKVHRQTFHEGDLVWKAVLPEGFKDNTFGKWSPTWEDPYQ
ncbi:uncharacterized protein LOC127239338, partial [Andrographis paniculata]|uniref:uncharacterized protein LOC127239338 n=1 Tax=Andrographis paniculata TaxID=175694 RepID=UPI0021E96D33